MKRLKVIKTVVALGLLGCLCITGCGKSMEDVRTTNVKTMTPEDAKTELSALLKRVSVSKIENPVLDLSMDESVQNEALADISTFPLSVEGTGAINIEIAAATELSADAPDDWLNEVAEKFNRENRMINPLQ